jgi:PHP family Zn ribbon phosphoesterase
MAYVADLHIHSRYSGACSYELTIPNLSKWAVWKGIDLLGTGDALHPMWQQELKANLQDIGGGIYQNGETKFVVSGEISCIYSESGKTRRIQRNSLPLVER